MIPTIIHQMWKDAAVPPAFQAWCESWRRLHPTWDYRFWTDAALEAFVATHYPAFLATYRAYPQGIMRADAARVMLLHHFGGLYADLDAECLQPFDDLRHETRVLLAEEPLAHRQSLLITARRLPAVLCNAVMLSPPGHPFWLQVLAAMQRNSAAPSVLDATGPFLLSGVAERHGAGLCLLPAETFYPLTREGVGQLAEARAIHHWAGTWIASQDNKPPSRKSLRRARRRQRWDRWLGPRHWIAPPILPHELPSGQRLAVLRTAPGDSRRRAKERNALLEEKLGQADWVLWLDEGLKVSDAFVEQLLAAQAPLVAPNLVSEAGGFSCDLGSYITDWQPPEAVFWKFVKRGTYGPPAGLGRTYLSHLRYRDRQPLDSLGGSCLLVAAELHREGLQFPWRPYRFCLDAEGLSAQARDHGLELVGLPNLELLRS